MFYHWAALPLPPVPAHVAARVDAFFYYRDQPTGSGGEWGRARRAWARDAKTLGRLEREITDPDVRAIIAPVVGPGPGDLLSIRRTGRPRGRPRKPPLDVAKVTRYLRTHRWRDAEKKYGRTRNTLLRLGAVKPKSPASRSPAI